MNLELLFLSSLNACNPKLQEIFNITVLVSHILLLLTYTTKHKEPSNIRNPANVQTAFPSRGSLEHESSAMPKEVQFSNINREEWVHG